MLSGVLGIFYGPLGWPWCLCGCTAIAEVLDLLLGLPDDAVLEGGVMLLLACSHRARRR